MKINDIYRLLYRYNNLSVLYINRALYVRNAYYPRHYSTFDVSPDTQALLKAIIKPDSALDLPAMIGNAINNAKSIGELSIVLYSTLDRIQSFHEASNRILSLLHLATSSEIFTILRVIIHNSKVKNFNCFTQLADKFVNISIEDVRVLSPVDISNYFTVYSYLVDKGHVKASNLTISPLISLFESNIENIQPTYFTDILQALIQIKPIESELPVHSILEYVNKNIRQFNFNEIISVWHSLSSFAPSVPNDIFIKFSEILLKDSDRFTQLDSHSVTRLCTGIAKCRVKDLSITKIIDNMMPRIRILIESGHITLIECSKILVALENYGYKCNLMVQRIAKFFKNKRSELPNDEYYSQTIINLCIGFGRSLCNDNAVYNHLSELMLNDDFLDTVNTLELINIVHAYSKIRILDNKLMVKIHKVLKSRVEDIIPLELCIKYIYSISILEFKEYAVQKRVIEMIEGYGESIMDELQIAKVHYAASKLGIPCSIGCEFEEDNVAKWVSGNAGRKTGRIVLPYKPLHVRRMKKVW